MPSDTSLPAATLATSASKVHDTRTQLMAEFGIVYDGRQYRYGPYRYDRLDDAIDYARLQRIRFPNKPEPQAPIPAVVVEVPSLWQEQLMKALMITCQAGVYRLGAHRYERLKDAINYGLEHSARQESLFD